MRHLINILLLLVSGCTQYDVLYQATFPGDECFAAGCCDTIDTVWATSMAETVERIPEAYFIPDDPGPIFESIDFSTQAVLVASVGGCNEGERLRVASLRYDADTAVLHGGFRSHNVGSAGLLLGGKAMVFLETPREWVGPVDFELMR